ncbi:MAG: hypothetical protein M3042_10340 [Actinomycetota bacterium]|nr:hypothetical protein [Actinomycetota bacterium]
MTIVLRALAAGAGLVIVVATLAATLRTVVLPRGVPSKLARVVFLATRRLFALRLGRAASYERRDAVMALYGPISLLSLLAVWLVLILLGYTLIFLGLGWPAYSHRPVLALEESGSSLFTLGFLPPPGVLAALVSFSEAAIGMAQLALLISYLPSLYARFSQREFVVAKLEVRAGSPPRGWTMIIRANRLGDLTSLTEVWRSWEDWFIDVEESHTSNAVLVFFRSPQPDKSWVTAAGAVLDGAALRVSALAAERDVEAQLCIRAGFISLRRIASYFQVPFDPDPAPTDPISISRMELDSALDEMAAAGVALKPDRDQIWRDFAGWRVNYDTVLIGLAQLTMAAYAPWSSDRSLARRPQAGLRRLVGRRGGN